LHGVDGRDQWLGCVGSASAQRIESAPQTLTFTVPLRDDPAVAKVWALVVLSAAGDWGSQTMLARSEPITVRGGATPAAIGPLALHDLVSQPKIEESGIGSRAIVASVWLAASLLFWRRQRSHDGRSTVVLAAICLGLAAFELSGVGPRLQAAARAFVQHQHLYDQRRLAQRIASVTVLLVCAAVTVWFLRRRRHVPAFAIAGIGLYAAVALLGMLSLHEADRLLGERVLLLPLGDVLRLGAALLTLVAAAGSSIHPSRGPTPSG
jgi:hypothetical protein